MDELQRNT
jgi:hypothetical protein